MPQVVLLGKLLYISGHYTEVLLEGEFWGEMIKTQLYSIMEYLQEKKCLWKKMSLKFCGLLDIFNRPGTNTFVIL